MTLLSLKLTKTGKTYTGDVALGLAVTLSELPWQPVKSNNADEDDDDDDYDDDDDDNNNNNNNNSEIILLYCYNSVK